MTDHRRDDEAVGSAAEEAVRLLGALQEWARRSATGVGDRVATGAPECRLCPVCQVLGVMRHAEPEVFDHLTDAASSLLAAFRAAVAGHAAEWSAPPTAKAEHIDVE